MRATFEEKTYENYFNNELAQRSDVYFPLGQIDEGDLGFDSSTFTRDHWLWRRLSHPFWFRLPFRGLPFQEIADEMEHFLGVEIDQVPAMKTNLLFQYKKPDFITNHLGAEWRHWNTPYYRYKIYREQQDLLMQIHISFGTRVLVLYASPALHKVDELVRAYLKRNIIERSNFKKACDLDAHERNTYTQAGTFSIACSEPEKIDNIDLLTTLNRLVSADKENVDETNRNFIINFRKAIVSLVYENRFYSESFRSITEILPKIEKYPLLYSFVVMHNFRQLTGIQWLIKLPTNAS